VLIRVNPDIDPEVHPYISTGLRSSKFGIGVGQCIPMIQEISKNKTIQLLGVHCHLGSNIHNIDVYQQTMKTLVELFELSRDVSGQVNYINLGGGLGITYQPGEPKLPTPNELILAIRDMLPEQSTLILEPGRSIVANAGILVCRVIGVKENGDKKFIVTDASMTEMIRPSLYSAYHQIGFVEPVSGETARHDFVGPVCESADFLGKDRALPTPPEQCGVAVFDTGAYGFVMSSNYNARNRPAEYLVDADRLLQIRRHECFEDQLQMFEEKILL